MRLQFTKSTFVEVPLRSKSLFTVLVVVCMMLSACGSEPEPTAPTPEPAAVTTPDASGDPLSGTWTGDWGPNANDRNMVTLELKWDGTNLTGTVNPGPQAVPLSKASYAADTKTVMMEADAPGRGGTTVHFVVDGKVEGNVMSGSWSHDDKKGDFKITKN
jgi:hypothetical protein